MPVILAVLSKFPHVRVIGLRPEHAGLLAVAGDAITTQVAEMPGERPTVAPAAHDMRKSSSRLMASLSIMCGIP